MTTQTLIHIIQNRRKSGTCNPTEDQFLAEVEMALERLKWYEDSDEDDE